MLWGSHTAWSHFLGQGYWSWEGFLLSLYILYQQISASCNQDEVMRGDLSKILIDLLWSLPSVTIPVTIVVTVAPGWVKWDVTNISSALSYGMHWSSPDTQYLYISPITQLTPSRSLAWSDSTAASRLLCTEELGCWQTPIRLMPTLISAW